MIESRQCPYAGGTFLAYVDFGEKYPHAAPEMYVAASKFLPSRAGLTADFQTLHYPYSSSEHQSAW